MSTEQLLNRVSMILLVIAGIFFIYEGAVMVDAHRENPKRIPPKVAVAGSLTIVLGILSLGFAILHFFFAGGETDLFKNMFKTKPTSNAAKVNTR